MTKTVLITGATDGIGLEAAKEFAAKGHKVLLHGRSADKMTRALEQVGGGAEGYLADLTSLDATRTMASEIRTKHDRLDVLINNAGVLKAPQPIVDGMDVRLIVNTLAPYVLAQALLPIMPKDGRILNLSSAAQARVDMATLTSGRKIDDMSAYSQSKLGITIWSQEMAKAHPDGPTVIAVNPGSLLATNMVRDGFGIAGNDISIGSGILVELALGEGYDAHSGQYWDNDAGRFGPPNAAAKDPGHVADVMAAIRRLVL
ncbi:MAG: SDR family NAD(P)-dependent oxidoreductase [Pseudomonadota bacterium]